MLLRVLIYLLISFLDLAPFEIHLGKILESENNNQTNNNNSTDDNHDLLGHVRLQQPTNNTNDSDAELVDV